MRVIRVLLCFLLLSPCVRGAEAIQIGKHELSRPARPWEFLDAVGSRSGLLGNESGHFEAWVYPLKLFRDFDVTFVLDNRRIPAASLVRRLIMRPEGPTLIFAADSFTVSESWLAPVDENGAIIRFEIDTWQPLQIEASFSRDFQLMWPAGLGGTYMSWNAQTHTFELGEEGRKFAGVVGSPTAVSADPEFFSNSYAGTRSTFRLTPAPKGRSLSYILIAGSTSGPDDARNAYQRLASDPERLFTAAHKYYEDYLSRTLSLELPDPQLQAAYDWARISVIQGLVANPFLGKGLVAGYRSSGDTARPGFAWFFGRDSLWTDLALDSIGDFDSTKTALDFIARYQRQDGKIEHEISQTASLVDWWKGFPYGFASADATPLFLIAMNDYVTASGDIQFAAAHWDNAWRAYQFLKSTYDANGLPRNFGIGHGWIEGGPLLPVETESYQSGLAAAALRALEPLARAAGKQQEAAIAAQEFITLRNKINDSFWDADSQTLVFALDRENKRVPTATVLSTAPMWFDVFDTEKANATIDHIANWDHAADWGMRIISEQHPQYGPTGYHFGSVWPLFTGWAAVGEYRNHRPLEAYANLRANSLLALDASLGRVTEVLSGSYYEGLGTASPHQIWSSAMVLSPMVRGLLGISVDEARKSIRIAPHIPADWNSFALENLSACGGKYDIAFRRTEGSLWFNVAGDQNECTLEFSVAVSKHANVSGAGLRNRKLAYKVEQTTHDQHVNVQLQAPRDISRIADQVWQTLQINVTGDFGLAADADLPPLGSESSNLKIFHEDWSADRRQLTVKLSGVNGRKYDLRAYGAKIASVNGGELKQSANGNQVIEIVIPQNDNPKYVEREITIRF
ncbi:MAG TPA: amylo-alpha-1,6-glucosidase [Terriglobales bacterium]|nr:amylo-alpha-1,6-glucosidase [Terriglobales bacterium]